VSVDAPDAAAPPVAAELPESEWRAKIRTVATPCGKDQVRERAMLPAPDGGACPKQTVIGLELVHGAELDPLANSSGAMCHYTYCDPVKPKRVARPTCHEPRPELSLSCFAPPEGGTKLPAAAPFQKCPAGIAGGMIGDAAFDPKQSRADECCYVFCGGRVVPGRPFRIAAEPIVAATMAGSAWLGPPNGHVSDDAEIAARWLRDAAFEHASIAAFARLSLDLLAHGAPPKLVAMAHTSALEEIEHARICFAFARASGATEYSPAPQPSFAMPRPLSLAELAVETFLDGCLGETFASLVLHARAAATTDPSAARLLRQMADEEARHAELAWAIVAWAVDQQPALVDAIQHAWQSRVTTPPATGWLPPENEARLHREALERVVQPCLRALAA
jgi:hypothetical protein